MHHDEPSRHHPDGIMDKCRGSGNDLSGCINDAKCMQVNLLPCYKPSIHAVLCVNRSLPLHVILGHT